MTSEELERYIEQICAGLKLVDIDDVQLVFKNPSNLILLRSRRLYDLEFVKSKKDGLLTTEEMKKLITERSFISQDDRNRLSSLKSKLEGQKVLLARTLKVKANQERIKKIIDDLEKQIREIEIKERTKYSMTADTAAEESRLLYLCWACCYDAETDSLYWKAYNDFATESRLIFRQKVLSEFITFYGGINTTIIRSIARSNLWRIRYVTSLKTSEPLFGVPTSEYSNDMLNLAYWSHFYQNIYEMMPEDQPSELIIDDDVALDAYMKDFYDERSKDAAARRDKGKRYGKLSAFNQQEVIVTRANELYEDISYDKPKEAQAIKDGILKQEKESHKNRVGMIPENLRKK
jgi:hypothetical protein